MAKRFAALTLTSALLASSCASSQLMHEPWVYGISRVVYGGDWAEAPIEGLTSSCHSENEAWAWVAILLLPFAVDTVLLPVTVPHDLWLAK